MSFQPAKLLRGLALVILAVAWALLAHLGSAGSGNPDFSAALATAPLVVLVVILLWRVGNPLWIAVGGLGVLGLLAWAWPALRDNVPLLFYIQHLGTNLALAALFGRSLLGGHEALITQVAKVACGGRISPAKTRYTRQVTVAWTLFFVANAGISSLLFGLAPPFAWSVFANILSLPLLVLMFAAEHITRHHVLPPEDRSSIADTIHGYRSAMAQRRRDALARHS